MTHRVIIETDCGTDTISRHIYGHFAEHLGRCIYEGIWVGEDSPIPNTRGIRNDVVAALKALNIPNLRWPGGCFADEYHWKNGIGPREERPTMINTHWGGVTENNHFGTHEFFDLCEQLECEPYICGNVGSGTVQEMSEWVEYITFGGTSPMADLRRKNGREEPWEVKYWGVGNESWGCGGHFSAERYAEEYRRYACYCRNYGENKLYKIACGTWGGLEEASIEWTDVLMKKAANANGLSLHYYASIREELAGEFDASGWFKQMKLAMGMEERLVRHGTAMDRYDPEKKVGMIVDEWGTWFKVEEGTNPGFLYQQSTMRDALVAGLTLNLFNHHADRVHMANIAQTVNVLQSMILTEGEKMLCTPTYHVFEMYKVHHDATLLPSFDKVGTYEMGDDSLPQISTSASLNEAGEVNITLCNLHHAEAATVRCDLRGMAPTQATGRVLAGEAMNAMNTFDATETVLPTTLDGIVLDADSVQVTLPAHSVAVVTVK